MPSSAKPSGVYLVIAWISVNIAMLTYMILTHPDQPNSLIEMLLWVPSIVGLWRMRKWGAALTVAVLGITLGISLNNLLLTYNSSSPVLTFIPINTLRVILNSVAITYLFKGIFAGKFAD